MSDLVTVRDEGAVRVLTMNRPDKLNALNGELIGALSAALAAAQANDDVAVLVLAGAGRAFCAGADTAAGRRLAPETRPAMIRHADHSIALFRQFARTDKPIIAAVHGYALGAGAILACASDLVVAAESARFGFPELKIGLTASTVTALFVHLAGRKAAFELLTLCENIGPARALELGMINRVVAEADPVPAALAMANTLAGWNKHALWQTKRTFHRALALGEERALEMARDISVMMGRFPD